jgi:hypothetical protein
VPQYQFITRSVSDPFRLQEVRADCPDNDAAIENARVALSEAMRDAAMERRLLDEEIEVIDENGSVVAVVGCDAVPKH